MDVLNPMTYDAEEDKLRERTKYSQMDKLLVPVEFQQQPVSTGTTIMAVEYDGGVIIGADTRTSAGSFVVNRYTDKLTALTDQIFCLRSGSAADTQAIAQVVQYQLDFLSAEMNEPPLVRIAANCVHRMIYEYRDDLLAGMIVAGWDKKLGGQVYSCPLGGLLVRQPVTLGGSGSTYIWGYMDDNFRPNMTQQECYDFVLKGITLAITRDGSSGGCARIAIINKDGVERIDVLGNDLPKVYDL
jgi:20S proteasome subunit beta 1